MNRSVDNFLIAVVLLLLLLLVSAVIRNDVAAAAVDEYCDWDNKDGSCGEEDGGTNDDNDRVDTAYPICSVDE